METAIRGKRVLLVQGSSLASAELFDALCEAGAKPYPTSSVINAYNLIDRIRFDGASTRVCTTRPLISVRTSKREEFLMSHAPLRIGCKDRLPGDEMPSI